MEENTRILEMVEWLAAHQRYRREICNDHGFPSSDEEFLELFQELEKKGYYELLVVILIKHSWDLDSVSTALTRLFARKVLADWRQSGSAAMCREFRALFLEEAARGK